MPITRLSVAFFLLLIYCSSFSQDYTRYHLSVNNAEKEIFVNKKIAEGLKIYQQTFSSYDFVFVSDCLTASQIALYAKDETRFLQFMKKAFENGLLPRNIKFIYYIKDHPLYIKYQDSLVSIFKASRKHYLQRIDTTALKQFYEMYALDQAEKNGAIGAAWGSIRRIRDYNRQIGERMRVFGDMVATRGWPGEKLIGLAQKDIMMELNTGKPDLAAYYKIYKDDYRVNPGQYEIEEQSFASTFFFPILIHYCHSWKVKDFFDDSVYLEQIKKGNLHPKDLAAVFDSRYNDPAHHPEPDPESGDRYFGHRKGTQLLLSPSWINKFRAKFFIPPIENDLAKWQFMDEQGMYCSYGYYGDRA